MTGGSPGHAPVAPRRSRLRSRGVAVLVATISTLVVFGVVIWLVVNAPGWPTVQQTFFDADRFATAWPKVVAGFLINLQIWITAAGLILVCALVLAILRSLDDPVFFPFKLFAIVYIDVFRGLPSIILVYVLGLGIAGLRLPGVSNDVYLWGMVTLVLVWSAYVAEVYRAGLQSVHPSQAAAARSLGLSGVQTFRYVVLPQAIRRIIPPLLNDMIGLQKDTALLSFLGIVEAFRRSQIIASANFNFTPYMVSAVLFLLFTIPMARFVDWLVSRDRRRYLAGSR